MKYSDETIMQALIEQGTVRGAARAIGCNRETVQRRLDDPTFAKALYQARVDTVTALADKLKTASFKALDVLMKHLNNVEDISAAIKCADVILKHAETFAKLSKSYTDDW